jgi:hypothetical protein
MKTRIFQTRWGASTLSAIISVASGVAIISFGAPPAILILASWAGAAVYMAISARIDRRFDRR